MKKTKFQRITAFALALLLLIGGSVTAVSGAVADSVSKTTTDDIKALMNAVSYSGYMESNAKISAATKPITLDAIEDLDEASTTAQVSEGTYGEENRKG